MYNLLSQGKVWPAITGQQIDLKSCSNPPKTCDGL